MEITPYKNGIHSLAKSLRNLKEFLDDGGDPYLMKEVVINSHHGLEILFKDILFQKNPIFLLDEKTSVKSILEFYKGFFEEKNNYLFDDAKTITPIEAIKRLTSLRIITGISKKDYHQLLTSFETLNNIRNQLQHFAIKADPDNLIKVLGNLIPRSVDTLKRYYSSPNDLPHQIRASLLPHSSIHGMESLFSPTRDIEADLNEFYKDSTSVINELEQRYDILLNEAIQKFKTSLIKSSPLNLKVRDHGHCGASPYMPEISLDGWLNEDFTPHRNAVTERIFPGREPISAVYEATTIIQQPKIIKDSEENNHLTRCKNIINIKAKISVLNVSSFIKITELEEYTPFIKSPEIDLLIDIEFESEGMFNEHHYNVDRITKLKGCIKVDFNSMMYGDSQLQPSVSGTQEIKLDKTNTSISLHSFVESNRKLRDNYSLEIGVEGVGDITFK